MRGAFVCASAAVHYSTVEIENSLCTALFRRPRRSRPHFPRRWIKKRRKQQQQKKVQQSNVRPSVPQLDSLSLSLSILGAGRRCAVDAHTDERRETLKMSQRLLAGTDSSTVTTADKAAAPTFFVLFLLFILFYYYNYFPLFSILPSLAYRFFVLIFFSYF